MKTSDTTQDGMMFAAHCGADGSQWVKNVRAT